MRKRGWLGLVSGCAGFVAGCGAAPSGENNPVANNLHVFVSIPPQLEMIERLGGRLVRAEALVDASQSPHSFEPTPRQIARLCEARAFFAIGLPFEAPLLNKVRGLAPKLQIIATGRDVPHRTLTRQEGQAQDAAHAAHPDEDEQVGAPDVHIWLSPRLVKMQCETMCQALASLDPPHAGEYRENLASYQRDLDALDRELRQMLGGPSGREFFVLHAAYGYFADDYGLVQVAIENQGKEPGPHGLVEIVRKARQAGARAVFAEPQYARRGAEALANQVGAQVVMIDPYSRQLSEGLRDLAGKLADYVAESAP